MTAGLLITSATVRVVLDAGMPRILPMPQDPALPDPDSPSGNVHPIATTRSRRRATQVTSRRDAPRVSQLTTLLRSLGSFRSLEILGNAGALANVRSVLADRRREDWRIEGLVRRLEPAAVPADQPAQPARPARSTHAA
mgnify:CR=1 FL=1